MEAVTDTQNLRPTKGPAETMPLAGAVGAAEAGDPTLFLATLDSSKVLGYLRHYAIKTVEAVGELEELGDDDLDESVAEAVDALYTAIREGRFKGRPIPFLRTVVSRQALRRYQRRRQEQYVPHEYFDDVAELPQEDQDYEALRDEAIHRVRSYIPRLGQENIQRIFTFLIDALVANNPDVSNAELSETLGLSVDTIRYSLSRGYDRLKRLAAEGGLHSDELLGELEEQVADLLPTEEQDEEYEEDSEGDDF